MRLCIYGAVCAILLQPAAWQARSESVAAREILRDFDEPATEPVWRAENDGVMGGVSTGHAQIGDGALRFSGELSLENNGGFAQVFSLSDKADFSAFRAIRLRVKGDGRSYQFRLATDALHRGSRIAYWSAFATRDAQWSEAVIPFSSFSPSFRGRALEGPPLDLQNVHEIALLLADGKPGGFDLLVDWIALEK